ncbi:MAG: rod shape-determining protein MreD [Legionellales bacterium]|nr:rod shape-determining protein MreD [Legionellales bacterium]
MHSNIIWKNNAVKYLSLLICLFLGLYFLLLPLPNILSNMRPNFLAIVLVYLLLQEPPLLNLSIIFFIGIFMDILLSYPIGIHSLAFALLYYIVIRLYRQLRIFPTWQQSIYIASIVFLSNIVVYTILSLITNVSVNNIYYILASWISTVLVYPWVKNFLDKMFRY